MLERYYDRKEAGKHLAGYLDHYIGTPDLLVLGLPRGGVVVAYEVALALKAELDIFLVRKIGTPGEPELAMGAIAEGGMVMLNDSVVNFLSISKDTVQAAAENELTVLRQRERVLRGDRSSKQIRGKTVIVVDDGLATGATMKVAVKAIQKHTPDRLAVAVPVGSPSTVRELKVEADEVICPLQPAHFMSVGSWYQEFEQTTDQEVIELLQRSRNE